jgi:hypothetical protein
MMLDLRISGTNNGLNNLIKHTKRNILELFNCHRDLNWEYLKTICSFFLKKIMRAATYESQKAEGLI